MADGTASTGPSHKKTRQSNTTRQERRLISKATSDIISELVLSQPQCDHSSSTDSSFDENLSFFNDCSDSGDRNNAHNNLNSHSKIAIVIQKRVLKI